MIIVRRFFLLQVVFFSLFSVDGVAASGRRNLKYVEAGFQFLNRSGGWKIDSNPSDPEALVRGRGKDGIGFLIAPIFHEQERVEMDALCRAGIQDLNLIYPSPEVEGSDLPREILGHRVRKLVFETVDKITYHQQMYVLSKPKKALLLRLWKKDNAKGLDQAAESLFGELGPVDEKPLDISKIPQDMREKNGVYVNQIGIFYYEAQRYKEAMQFFRQAVKFDESWLTPTTNLMNCYVVSCNYSAGLKHIAGLPDSIRHEEKILGWEAWLLSKSERKQEALALYNKLVVAGYRNVDDLDEHAGILAKSGDWPAVEKLFFTYYSDTFDKEELLIRYTRLLTENNKDDEAIKAFETHGKTHPLTARVAIEWAQTYLLAGQADKALPLAASAIKNGWGGRKAYYLKAKSLYRLGRYGEAKTMLEALLEKEPAYAKAESLLQYTNAQMGCGKNHDVKQVVEPVPIPAELKQMAAEAIRREKPPEDRDSYLESKIEAISFVAGKEYRETKCYRIRIVSEAGVDRYSTIQQDYDNLYERIHVNQLKVYDKEGKLAAHGNPEAYFVVDKQNNSMATYENTLNIPVPKLAAGSTIELMVTREALTAEPEFVFERKFLESTRPTIFSALYVTGDVEKVKFENFNGAHEEKLSKGLLWRARNLRGYEYERLAPRFDLVAPAVYIGETRESWNQAGREYWQKVKQKFAQSEVVVELANRLVPVQPDDKEEIIQRMASYIRRELTYKMIEFGRRGLIPNSGEVTVANGYGDCKDFTVLLHSLLKAKGIVSHPALVNSSMSVAKSLPTSDQFNHVILYVPDVGGDGLFVDATDDDYDPRCRVPDGLALARALIITPEKAYMKQIPQYPGGSSVARVATQIKIVGDGGAVVKETLELEGFYAAYMRTALKEQEACKLRQYMQEQLLNVIPDTILDALKVENLYNRSAPLRIVTEYRLGKKEDLVRQDGQRQVKPQTLWLPYYFSIVPFVDRRYPLNIRYPFLLTGETKILLPPGFAVATLPEASEEVYNFAWWKSKSEKQGDVVTQNYSCGIVPGTYPKECYKTYWQMFCRAEEGIRQPIVFDKSVTISKKP